MTDVNCKICKEPERARLIEADWAGGMSAKGIALRMTEAGWPIIAGTVLSHLKKHVPQAATRENVPKGMAKRDASILIQSKILDRWEELEAGETRKVLVIDKKTGEASIEEIPFDIFDKDIQPALKTALGAQAEINKQVNKAENRKLDFVAILSGLSQGKLGVPTTLLIDDGNTIDGDYEVVETE